MLPEQVKQTAVTGTTLLIPQIFFAVPIAQAFGHNRSWFEKLEMEMPKDFGQGTAIIEKSRKTVISH